MARAGNKLAKLKSSVLKKWSSFGSSNNKTSPRSDDDSSSASSRDLRQVYVGKSRRRYLVNSDVADHPVFRELSERESSGGDAVNVACEVVLFEHLLWMLKSSEPSQLDSLDELVHFYC